MPRVINTQNSDLVAWARYEATCPAIDPATRPSVHDALWMLTQQWRTNEFEGEDAGTLVKAKIETQSTFLNRFKSRNGSVESFRHDVPLEAKVERLPLFFDLGMQIEIGWMWEKILNRAGLSALRANYRTAFPIDDYENAATTSTNVQYKSNTRAMQVRKATVQKLVNGGALYKHLYELGQDLWTNVTGVSQSQMLTTAQAQFKTWLENTYYWPVNRQDNSWSDQQLEYQFSMSAPSGTGQTVYVGDQYATGDLDWYAVDRHKDSNAALKETGASISDQYLTGPYASKPVVGAPNVVSYLPHTIDFKGMPKGRWWEFEDRNIDIARMVTQRQDISRMVLMEFGLRYSNDYFIIPHRIENGTLTEVKGLVATDVFGTQYVIRRADESVSAYPEYKWDMYNNSRQNMQLPDTSFNKMLLAPSLINRMESAPLETVMFVRDEMSNMVWGIEDVVPDELMSGMDGRGAANTLVDYIGKSYVSAPHGSYVPNNAELRFKLVSNTVPENWIPFVAAVPASGFNLDGRAVKLQRAAMYRYLVDNDTSVALIKPRTALLSVGLNPASGGPQPYYINEEEVSGTGFSLTTTYQRTRWYDGRTYVWLGRKKRGGRGEVASGLVYDTLTDKQKGT